MPNRNGATGAAIFYLVTTVALVKDQRIVLALSAEDAQREAQIRLGAEARIDRVKSQAAEPFDAVLQRASGVPQAPALPLRRARRARQATDAPASRVEASPASNGATEASVGPLAADAQQDAAQAAAPSGRRRRGFGVVEAPAAAASDAPTL